MWKQEKVKVTTPSTVLLRRLIRNLAPYKLAFVAVAILTIVNSFASLAAPYILGLAIDNYILRGDLAGLLIMAGLYVVCAVGQWASQSLRGYALEWVGQKFLNSIRRQIFEKLQKLSFSFYNKRRVGELISIVVNDTSTLQEVLVTGVFSVIGDLITLVGILAAMFMLSIPLTLVSLTIIPVMIAVAYVFSSKMRKAYRMTREKIAKVTAKVQESISGIKVIQAFGREDAVAKSFRAASRETLEANVAAGRLMALFWPIIRMLSTVATVLVLWYGGYLTSIQAVSIGTLVAFLSYVTRFTMPIMTLVNMYDAIQAAFAAAERIFNILDVELDVKDAPDAIELTQIKGKIEFRNVYFEYNPGMPVLKNINLTINPGEIVALVGPTGAGKTTLVSLLCRFYDVKRGSILIDGHDIRKIKQKSLRMLIGFVPQETYLFPGTIMENIKIGKPGATERDVINVCKKLGIHNFIMRLPHGYETDAGEAGRKLSTGEKQLIAFARAMLRNPSILILDEAMSSVDPQTEEMIKNAIKKLFQGKTGIIIAHRLTLARDCDRIIVIHNGEIIEEGSHNELMERKGLYYKLYTSQLGMQATAVT